MSPDEYSASVIDAGAKLDIDHTFCARKTCRRNRRERTVRATRDVCYKRPDAAVHRRQTAAQASRSGRQQRSKMRLPIDDIISLMLFLLQQIGLTSSQCPAQRIVFYDDISPITKTPVFFQRPHRQPSFQRPLAVYPLLPKIQIFL